MSLNHKEVMEALLAGKVLMDIEDNNLKMRVNKETGYIELYSEDEPMWTSCEDEPTMCLLYWKLEPETININGHEVPKPLTECDIGDAVYMPGLDREDLVIRGTFYKTEAMNEYLHRGLLHSTKEEAIAHAKALLAFTEAAT